MIAVIEAIAVAPEPVAAAVKAVVAPSHPAAEPVAHTGQNHQTPLLAVVEGLVERVGGIGDFLQSRRGLGHAIGARPQPRHRIDGCLLLVRVIRVVLPGLHPGVGTVDPQLGEITHRLFHRRPQLLLIRRQREAGVDCRNSRIGESRPVLRTDPRVLMGPGPMLMGIHRGRTGNGERCDPARMAFFIGTLLCKVR